MKDSIYVERLTILLQLLCNITNKHRYKANIFDEIHLLLTYFINI